MQLSNGVISTTTEVWNMLNSGSRGDIEAIRQQVKACPELAYAQYNYTPPIHFAVREGHIELVKYLLTLGAHDPSYKIYPFLDSLQTMALDRGYEAIATLLDQYHSNPGLKKYKGDYGQIYYNRTNPEQEFEQAVDKNDLNKTEELLKEQPGLVKDLTYFWSEGIMMMPAKAGNFKLLELLLRYGAQFPDVSKWSQFYYFERYDSAAFILDHGMNPNHMSWHRVTILHDMAQKGNIPTAKLLIDHGAAVDLIDEEYSSTPLAMATRWGHIGMVRFLLENGANPNTAGAEWSTPLAWARKKDIRA